MLSYSLEMAALVLFAIIGIFHYDTTRAQSPRYWLFNKSLMFASFTTLLDILSSYALNHIEDFPLALNHALSSAYFICLHLSIMFLSLYGYYLLYERISNKKKFRALITYLLVTCTMMGMLAVTNYWTGAFFRIENGAYYHGPLNRAGYLLTGINIALYYVIYLIHRQEVGTTMRKLMRILVPTFVVMGGMQIFYPNMMMIGLLMAVLELVYYVNSQNNQLGQDSLTDLPNRQIFFQQMGALRKKDDPQHIILIYFENFQDLNHRFGIAETDTLIFQIARYLEMIAPSYRLYRYSSTRFLLMGPYQDDYTMERIVRLILDRFNQSWEIGDSSANVHVHMAHMSFVPGECEDDNLIDQLEYTLNVSKQTGDSNSYILFNDHYKYVYNRNQFVLKEVQNAIETQSFDVYYQPIYSQKDRKFIAAEALVRLRDSKGELLSPGEFIPLAEENGLLNDISWIVIEKVCQFLHHHPELDLRTVSINISSDIITDVHFLSRFRSILAQYQISNEKIKLEITERTISSKPALVKSVMLQLDSEGIRFSLDDFGTGYSNFEAMLTLPFQTVKLDRSIMKHIDRDERYRNMVKMMVEVLMNSRFEIVAEGLETEAQIKESRDLNIDCIQGFYYAKPMPAGELLDFLTESKKVVNMSELRANSKHA